MESLAWSEVGGWVSSGRKSLFLDSLEMVGVQILPRDQKNGPSDPGRTFATPAGHAICISETQSPLRGRPPATARSCVGLVPTVRSAHCHAGHGTATRSLSTGAKEGPRQVCSPAEGPRLPLPAVRGARGMCQSPEGPEGCEQAPRAEWLRPRRHPPPWAPLPGPSGAVQWVGWADTEPTLPV